MHRTPRAIQKALDFVVINKYSILGLGFCKYFTDQKLPYKFKVCSSILIMFHFIV